MFSKKRINYNPPDYPCFHPTLNKKTDPLIEKCQM